VSEFESLCLNKSRITTKKQSKVNNFSSRRKRRKKKKEKKSEPILKAKLYKTMRKSKEIAEMR
jgi:hypothetical protein